MIVLRACRRQTRGGPSRRRRPPGAVRRTWTRPAPRRRRGAPAAQERRCAAACAGPQPAPDRRAATSGRRCRTPPRTARTRPLPAVSYPLLMSPNKLTALLLVFGIWIAWTAKQLLSTRRLWTKAKLCIGARLSVIDVEGGLHCVSGKTWLRLHAGPRSKLLI